jgi:hypothetical protein
VPFIIRKRHDKLVITHIFSRIESPFLLPDSQVTETALENRRVTAMSAEDLLGSFSPRSSRLGGLIELVTEQNSEQ